MLHAFVIWVKASSNVNERFKIASQCIDDKLVLEFTLRYQLDDYEFFILARDTEMLESLNNCSIRVNTESVEY